MPGNAANEGSLASNDEAGAPPECIRSVTDFLAALRHHFGSGSLHPAQGEGVLALIEGQNTRVVLPTDAGKSLDSQLATLLHQRS